jgi:hypothetical protein
VTSSKTLSPLTDLQKDIHSRESFSRLNQFYATNPFVNSDFTFLAHTIINSTGAPMVLTNYEINHGLGFQPTDLITTSVNGSGTVLTWKYDKFTASVLVADITIPAGVTTSLRMFVGRYSEGQNG